MRVNVSAALISKTFVYGLKVSLKSELTKSNIKSLEFNLNINHKKLATTQLLLEALNVLVEFAIFANLLLPLTLLYAIINIFISFNVFSRLTVLMNDLRLKTFYCKTIQSSKFIKNSTTTTSSTAFNTTLATTSSTLYLKLSLAAATATLSPTSTTTASSSTVAVAAAFATSNKNNNYRTYNNSSKSNKVFLYYTPRDPHLRIFLKTKHFFSRHQQQQQPPQYQLNKIKNIIYSTTGANNNNGSLKVFNDLCNYGELIGGSGGGEESRKSGGECNSVHGIKTICKQLKNCANLNPTKTICDNLIKPNDNLSTATAGAAIDTVSANIFINIIIVAVISEYAKELLNFIEILSSFIYNQQHLKVTNVKSRFGLYENFL